MNRQAFLGTSALVALLLVGCQSATKKAVGPATSQGLDKVKVGIVYDNGGLGDKSFNDSASRGIEKAKTTLGAEVVQIESKDAKDYESNLREVAAQGCDIVFAVGINMQNDTVAVAKEFPKTKFAIVDASIDLPNVRSLLFKEEEGSYLAGYLAGLMTKTNMIGFVGGEDIPLIRKFETGYRAGAEEANHAVILMAPKFTGNWNNIDDASVAADLLFGQGADIVYHAAGRAGLGVIRSAAKHKKYAIGVDSDQDYLEPGHVLTSMVKRVDVAVFETVQDVIKGSFVGGEKVYDLAGGGVGLSEFKFTKDSIGAANLAKLDEVRGLIVSKAIRVPANMAEYKMFEKLENSVFD